MKMIIDLKKDLNNIFKCLFIENGFKIDGVKDDDFVLAYLNFFRRRVSSGKRVMYLSDCFKCPDSLCKAWRKFRCCVEDGNDIAIYQSKQIVDLTKKDILLNDWGIYHFHLGEELDKGWIKRTDELVFAIVKPDAFYTIGIFKHGDWTNKDLLEIVHRNWPELLKRFRCRSLNVESLDNDKMKILRKKGYNFFVRMEDGTSYSPPGYGHVATGYCLSDFMRLIYIKRFLDNCEEKIIKKFKEKENILVKNNLYRAGDVINVFLKVVKGFYLRVCFPEYNHFSFDFMSIEELLNIDERYAGIEVNITIP